MQIPEDIIIRSIQKCATQDDLNILKEWLNEDEKNVKFYFQLDEIWNSGKDLTEEIIHKGWKMLSDQIALQSRKPPSIIISTKKQKTLWLRYVAAVFIGVVIASALWLTFSIKNTSEHIIVQNTVYNKTGIQSIVLSDNSVVWLNENSKLTYPESFVQNERIIGFKGRAYFEVYKNDEKPFIVQIDKAEIEICGTEFFVDSSSDIESIITLISGKVNLNQKFLNEKTLSTPLIAGEQATINYINNTVEIETVDTDYFVAWKDGTYSFTDESLEKIAAMLAQHYDLTIIVDNSLKNNRFTGRVIPQEDIESVLKSIAKSYPVKYRINGSQVCIEEIKRQ